VKRKKRRVKAYELKLNVGDSVVWPDGAIVVTEVVSPELFRTRDLSTMKQDWLQQHDWIEGDWTVVRGKL
jgi:hypothetical protein